METIIATEYKFSSAHWLPKVPDTHRCRRMHGHNYLLRVSVKGHANAGSGMVLDFFDLDKLVQPVVDEIDHRCLNDIDGLENPTAELIAKWFADRILAITELAVPITCRVYETPECYAEVTV